MIRTLNLIFVIVVVAATKTSIAAGAPLFESSEPIKITITAPMRDLLRRRKSKSEFDGVMQYEDASGALRELPIKVAARGNSRLEVCSFPPIRVTVDKKKAAGTLFQDQRRLKMVTKCKGSQSGANWLLLEHGIYVAYNEITDFSFRARLIEVTFRDTKSEKWQESQTAFFIESIGEAARRLDRKAIRPPAIDSAQYNLQEMAHNALFQYLIGNTDFSVKRGPSGEGCCHNGRTVAPRGSQKDLVILPYDFDQAGVMDTSYALPDERFRIRKVTSRLYRGFCWHNDELVDSIALFNERREQLVAALVAPGLSKKGADKTEKFVNRFFATVNDPKALQKQIFDKCRGQDSVTVRKSTTSQD
jgi:hypothetical protein